MGERHHRYIWYDGNSKQSGRGEEFISQGQFVQRYPEEDSLQKKITDNGYSEFCLRGSIDVANIPT